MPRPLPYLNNSVDPLLPDGVKVPFKAEIYYYDDYQLYDLIQVDVVSGLIYDCLDQFQLPGNSPLCVQRFSPASYDWCNGFSTDIFNFLFKYSGTKLYGIVPIQSNRVANNITWGSPQPPSTIYSSDYDNFNPYQVTLNLSSSANVTISWLRNNYGVAGMNNPKTGTMDIDKDYLVLKNLPAQQQAITISINGMIPCSMVVSCSDSTVVSSIEGQLNKISKSYLYKNLSLALSRIDAYIASNHPKLFKCIGSINYDVDCLIASAIEPAEYQPTPKLYTSLLPAGVKPTTDYLADDTATHPGALYDFLLETKAFKPSFSDTNLINIPAWFKFGAISYANNNCWNINKDISPNADFTTGWYFYAQTPPHLIPSFTGSVPNNATIYPTHIPPSIDSYFIQLTAGIISRHSSVSGSGTQLPYLYMAVATDISRPNSSIPGGKDYYCIGGGTSRALIINADLLSTPNRLQIDLINLLYKNFLKPLVACYQVFGSRVNTNNTLADPRNGGFWYGLSFNLIQYDSIEFVSGTEQNLLQYDVPPPFGGTFLTNQTTAGRITGKVSTTNSLRQSLSDGIQVTPSLTAQQYINSIDQSMHYTANALSDQLDVNMVDSRRTIEIHDSLGCVERNSQIAVASANMASGKQPNPVTFWYVNQRIARLLGIKVNTATREAVIYSPPQKIKAGSQIPPGWFFGQWGEHGDEDGLVIELASNEFVPDPFNKDKVSIRSGDYVLVNNLLQLEHSRFDTLDKAFDIQNLAAYAIPNADGSKRMSKFEGLLSGLKELLYMTSRLTEVTENSLISSLATQQIVKEILAGLGLPVVFKTIGINLGGGNIGRIPFPGLAKDAKSIVKYIGQLLGNVGIILGQFVRDEKPPNPPANQSPPTTPPTN